MADDRFSDEAQINEDDFEDEAVELAGDGAPTPIIPQRKKDELEAIDLVSDEEFDSGESSSIQMIGSAARQQRDVTWKRQPNADGSGATHVKTFHSKLRADSLEMLDAQVNEWLDAHRELEVKFVTTNIGEMSNKNVKELALIVSVWV